MTQHAAKALLASSGFLLGLASATPAEAQIMALLPPARYRVYEIKVTNITKGIDLSRIMEALREIVMYEKGSHINYDDIPPEEMMEWPQQAFIGGFRKYSV